MGDRERPLDGLDVTAAQSGHEAAHLLDAPRDRLSARTIVGHRTTVRARDQSGRTIDPTLVMTGFDFESVWEERRTFLVEGVELPVARLSPIIRSKAATNRDKDRLFLATQRHMLDGDEV